MTGCFFMPFMYKNSILELIGNTPMVRLKHFSAGNTSVYAKLEGQNPGGSIKDRISLAMIEDAQAKGLLAPGMTIIEPSSGNTGIGLAMVGAIKGYKARIVMPENATRERTILLKKLGAEVEYCSQEEWTGERAISKIRSRAKDDPSLVMLDQYENPVAAKIHYLTTAEEIIAQCPQITHFIAAIGTGGTITGVGKRLKEQHPQIQVIGVEIKADSKIPGPRNLEAYMPPIMDLQYIDRRVMIEDEGQIFRISNMLAGKEGIFYGLSSAAALSVAHDIAMDLKDANAKIVAMFPDKGDKYFSLMKH